MTAERLAVAGELVRLRILVLVMLVEIYSFLALAAGAEAWPVLTGVLLGTLLAGGGAMAMNQAFEHKQDACMQRTCNRPIPRGALRSRDACWLGALGIVGGIFVLAVSTNVRVALLGASSGAIYVFLYTPLKRVSWLSTSVGAVAGAAPALSGALALGRPAIAGLPLWLGLFSWQHIHFYSFALGKQADYARAGLHVLATEKNGEIWSRRLIVFFSVAVVGISFFLPRECVSPMFAGLVAAAVMGPVVWQAIVFDPEETPARMDRCASFYYPAQLVLLVASRFFLAT